MSSQVYSIDEAFLGVKGTPAELIALSRSIKAAVRRHVGVPVCVGNGPHPNTGQTGQQMAAGTPCIPMEEERIGGDHLIFSRSFSKPITTKDGTSGESRPCVPTYRVGPL